MDFTTQFLIPLAPVMIVALTATVVMLLIAIKRNHHLVATTTVIGLNLALLYILLTMFGGQFKPVELMGMFIIDPFTMLYQLIILVATLACCTLSHAYIEQYKDNKEELYILILLSAVGAMMMVASTHYASFFISLELMSVPIYGLLAYTHERSKSLESGMKYLVLSATASAMLLMGIAYIYAYTGTLSFATGFKQLWAQLQQHNIMIYVGVALIVFAMGFKLSLAPFHKWTSDVYQGAPAPLATFLASAAKVATIGLFVRYMLSAGTLVGSISTLLTIIAVLSIILGNLLAVRQTNIKRILAYSSIAHFGYLMVGFVSTNYFSLDSVNTYVISYVLTTIGAFGVISLVSSPDNELDSLDRYRGLFWKHPILTATMTVMMLSLAGIPLTAGFIGKFMVMKSAISAGQWFLSAMVILGSGIGLYYYLRVTVTMYKPDDSSLEIDSRWGQKAGGLMVLCAALFVLVMGVYPDPFIKIATLSQLIAPAQLVLFGH